MCVCADTLFSALLCLYMCSTLLFQSCVCMIFCALHAVAVCAADGVCVCVWTEKTTCCVFSISMASRAPMTATEPL